MKGSEKSRGIERHVALDIHKEYVLVGGAKCKAGMGAGAAADRDREVPQVGGEEPVGHG